MKTTFKTKIYLLCMVFIISVVGIAMLVLKSDNNNIKTFTEISEGMSKNLSQLRSTQGISLTGLAADPGKKLFKIGMNVDLEKVTSEQLKAVVESYLINTSSTASNKDWKSLLKPYDIRVEELASGKLIAEKPIDSTEFIWTTFLH